jgi:hypothetical protein
MAPTSPVVAPPRENSISAVAAGETTRRTTGSVLSGKRRRWLLQSKRPSVHKRAPPKANLPTRKPSAEQIDLCEGWNHVVRGGRVVKATTTPIPNPSPQPVTKAPEQPKLAATMKTARP